LAYNTVTTRQGSARASFARTDDHGARTRDRRIDPSTITSPYLTIPDKPDGGSEMWAFLARVTLVRRFPVAVVRSALIQTFGSMSMEENVERQIALIRKAADQGAQITCLQELATGPYFCQVQDPQFYAFAEPVPDGPTITRMREVAKRHEMVLIVPVYELEQTGVYYNTAAVIDADGTYLGKYRKTHIPQVQGFWEKFYFRPGNLGYPVFDTRYARVGVYIC
jgi:hypothetical protein